MVSELKGQTLVDALCKGEAFLDNDLKPHWNTRPAPAATDTGLVTVGGEYLDGHTWKPMPAGVTDFALRGFKTRALCDRSQAEELLAAKDVENAYLKELVAARGETIKRGDDRIRKLEADNAAQAARIKELEGKLDTAIALVTCCCGDPVDAHNLGSGHSPVDQYHYTMMQMEEKLAAAERERDHLIELGLSCGYGKPNPDLPRFELACSFIKGTDEARKAADIVWQDYKKQNEALKDKLRMTPQSNMWLQEDSVEKFKKFVMEKGILEGLWEISNMLGSYVDDGTPKPEADYMIKTQLFVDILTKFYEVESINTQLHREAREAIRIKRHFKEQSE